MVKKILLFLVVGSLLATPCFAMEWRVESFILPGINQAMQGRWVEAGFFFGMDAIALFIASTPVEKTYYLSHNPGDFVIVRDYTPLISGVAMYGLIGLLANVEYSQKLISVSVRF